MKVRIFKLADFLFSTARNKSGESVQQIVLSETFRNVAIFVFYSANASQFFGSFEEVTTSDLIAINKISSELQLRWINVDFIEICVVNYLFDGQSFDAFPFGDRPWICMPFFGLGDENILQLVVAKEELLEIRDTFLLWILLENFLLNVLCGSQIDVWISSFSDSLLACLLTENAHPHGLSANFLNDYLLELLLAFSEFFDIANKFLERVKFKLLFCCLQISHILPQPAGEAHLVSFEPL